MFGLLNRLTIGFDPFRRKCLQHIPAFFIEHLQGQAYSAFTGTGSLVFQWGELMILKP
jgi:hypothetical protein